MPTRSGWGVLACGTLFVVAGRLFGAIEFLLVGLVAVSAVALSAVLRSLRPSRVSVARQLTPPKVAAGETARVDLVVTNRRRWRSPVLSLHDAVAESAGVALRDDDIRCVAGCSRLALVPVEGVGRWNSPSFA